MNPFNFLQRKASDLGASASNQLPDRANLFLRYMSGLGGRNLDLDEKTLDAVMKMIYEDLGSVPYNAEDVCCDFIRWVENYIRPGAHYDNVDRDTVWSSSTIKDHPCGRQKAMLELGLVKSFNTLNYHPSDLKVLESCDLSIDKYKNMVNNDLLV